MYRNQEYNVTKYRQLDAVLKSCILADDIDEVNTEHHG